MAQITSKVKQCIERFCVHAHKLPKREPCYGLITQTPKQYELPPIVNPCVYFLISEGTIVYVGQSVDLPGRVLTHRKTKEFDQVLYVEMPPDWPNLGDALNQLEAWCILYLRPQYNRQIHGGAEKALVTRLDLLYR